MADQTSNEHRERAVEAVASRIATRSRDKIKGSWRRFADGDLAAAEPHLQRMYFEQFREAVQPVVDRLEHIRDLDEQTSDGSLALLARHALADLDKAQEIMEEGDAPSLMSPETQLEEADRG